ncbi:MAG: HDOD domain-containing protein [Planctomycetes bacterium]|nr:HDOD domain-containing protein [Planctomycetota bacterium]
MSDKKRILFVDDEQNVLDGLRRMLRSMRSEWDMAFATGGDEALEILATKRFDVIVSDLRMPGMSGKQLLAEVRKRHPVIVRLVLSGQADKDSILKSVGPIHQFLQKPCDEEMLKSTICRTIEMGDLFADENLKSMVTELESLPSPPSHQQELMAQFQIPGVSPKLIGESISRDLAMTAKILQLVNSSFFGLRRHVGNPADAVMLLGMDTVRSLVMIMQVFTQVSQDEIKGFSQDALLSHSIAVATIAKKIAQTEGMHPAEAEDAYLAGLLHDVGKLVFAAKRPEEFAEALAVARSQHLSGEEAERQVIGASHSEIGAYLLGLWAFETPIVDAALYHHCPGKHGCSRFSISTAVHVANAIVRQDPNTNHAAELDIDREYLDRIGVGNRLGAWQDASPCAA